MSRFRQRFAKLFDFGEEGQLVVLCTYENDDEGTTYQLQATTVGTNGVTMAMTAGYGDDEARRDTIFLDMDEEAARKVFTDMQTTLAQAGS